MKHLHALAFCTAALSVLATNVVAQTPKPSFTLNAPDTLPQRTYEARNFIVLKPGYRFTASTIGRSLVAKINPSLTFDITSIPNPEPGDASSAASDLPYIPGSTFTSDNPKDIEGVPDKTANESFSYRVFPVVWLRTMPKTGNVNGEYVWQDVCDEATKVKKNVYASNWEEYVAGRNLVRTYNFNPAQPVATDTYVKRLQTTKSDFPQATLIGVWGINDNFSTDQFLLTLQGRKDAWSLLGKRSVVHIGNTSNFNYGSSTTRSFFFQQNALESSLNAFREKNIRIGAYYSTKVPSHSLWGESADPTIVQLGTKSDTVTAWQNISGFKGYLPELLLFNHHLKKEQVQVYSSYLAIKYGVSLDSSYIDPKGAIIWDYTRNQSYNNRITGYGREDEMGLFQKIATTSYEEQPYFSDVYDSHDSADSYQSASRYRLLVMGLQPANQLNNNRYFVFGDNGGTLTYDSTQIPGYRLLNRKWLLQTNTNNDVITNKRLDWVSYGQNLVFTRKYSTNIYRGDLTKYASTSSSGLVTSSPLIGKDGHLSWTVDIEYGHVIAKFGTNQPLLTSGQHDYGYSFGIDGQVYSIIKGVIQPYSLFTIEKGQRLEIEKNERLVYLKVNGIRNKHTEFLMDSADVDKDFYGALIMGMNGYDFKLIDFAHGGFVNTGHRIELSYADGKASGFSNPEIGSIYLLVDTTGQGLFTGQQLEYACDEVDVSRSKIIFNNIFWDTSSTGRYAFTFAHRNVVTLRSWNSDDDEEEEGEKPTKDDVQIFGGTNKGVPEITVRVQTANKVPVTIHVYDLSGRRIKKKDLPASLDISHTVFQLPSKGLYIVKVVSDKHLHTQQVVTK